MGTLDRPADACSERSYRNVEVQRLFHGRDWFSGSWDRHSEPHRFNPGNRLDCILARLDQGSRLQIAHELAIVMFDIFSSGYAHRNLRGDNVYWHDGRVAVCGLEYLEKYPDGTRPAFSSSFDVAGQGLSPPKIDCGMWYCRSHPLALGSLLEIPVDRLLEEVRDELKSRLQSVSGSFRTKDRRMKTGRRRIYGSFHLPEFKVTAAEAQRDSRRRLLRFGVDEAAIRGKKILDLGANVGSNIFCLQEFSPASCVGIEYDHDKVAVANDIAAYCGLTTTRFEAGDIDALEARQLGRYDMVFCLAVDAHVRNRKRLYALLGEVTKQRLYFEGNPTTDHGEVRKYLLANGFTEVYYLGECDDDSLQRNNFRPLLVADKGGATLGPPSGQISSIPICGLPIVSLRGRISSRSSLGASGPPGESTISRLNPNRQEAIRVLMKWDHIVPGTLNLECHETLLRKKFKSLQPVWTEDASQIVYPAEYEFVLKKRKGYRYFLAVLRWNQVRRTVLIRRGVVPLPGRIEVLADIHLRTSLDMKDGDMVELEFDLCSADTR